MKIYTNENNTSTLKLLIAANLAGKKVDLQTASFADDVFAGPRVLPLLEVDDQLSFFSSNAAAQYLFPVLDLSQNGQCQQMQEWEATRLQPATTAVMSAKSPSAELRQALQASLQVVDQLLAKHKYILGDKLSAADVSIWSTIYPLYYNAEMKQQYIAEFKNIARWVEELAGAKAVQEALKQWNGSPNGPFPPTSALGPPQVATLVSPITSPEEVSGPTFEEIQSAAENWLNGINKLQPPLKEEKIVLPVKGRKNVLITSALPYVNNVPHLGNIIGCVLSADIFARYCRLCGYNTLYICGTDEYGTATETKAIEEGITPKQICDKYFEIHNAVYRWFDIGFDYFGRTSTDQQTEIAQKMFLKLMDNGFVAPQSVEQLLCEKCDRFLADRFVEGTCPHPGCLYDNARGDQCDKCGKLINAIELIEPRCKVCGHRPTVRPSEQLFIQLDQLEPSIRTWISSSSAHWSPAARGVCRAWLREPLRPRALTRDLRWGVPVPIDKYKNKDTGIPSDVWRFYLASIRPETSDSSFSWAELGKASVFYVWFDAPIGYLSITQNATKQYEKWWKPDKEYDVKLYQFMAKDNVPFHTIMFPATLIGINEGHLLVNYLFATEYLNYEEGKFSKSRGVGVFGTDAQDTGIPSDVWRFYLASIRPETSDSSFSWAELGTRNNSELLNNLGNFCHRSLSFCFNSFKGKVPDVKASDADYELIALVNREITGYIQNMEKGRLRDALKHVLSISRIGNQHMQSEQPWVLLKGSDDDKQRGATAIGLCCQLAALLCALLAPYIPNTARTLRQQLNVGADALRINAENPAFVQYLPPGHVINKPEPLFAKLEPEMLEKLRAKYAGTQSERANVNGDQSVASLEAAIAEQGDKVRKLKTSTKDKAVWQPEVDKLLQLKKQLATAQTNAKSNAQTNAQSNAGASSVGDLEKAVAEQGEKVRKLKASTKDKSVWQPEVDKLLELKKQLAAAQTNAKSNAQTNAQSNAGASGVGDLEKAVAEQGEKVRKLKASTKDKSVWQPEVDKLLDLKKQLAAAQSNAKSNAPTNAQSNASSAADLEKAVAEQGEKVRKLKASTKDKAVWQPEVKILLDLKKQLADLQVKN